MHKYRRAYLHKNIHSSNNKEKIYTIEMKQKKTQKKHTTYTNLHDC